MKKNLTEGIVNLNGGMTYDLETENVIFEPNQSIPDMVGRYRRRGVGMQMSDGTFEFVPQKRESHTSTLLQKLAHGSLTQGRDGKVRLSLVFDVERETPIDIAIAIAKEGLAASKVMAGER